MIFSSMLIEVKSRTVWKVRPMPRFAPTIVTGISFGLLLIAGLAGSALGACWPFGAVAHSRRSYFTPITRLSAKDLSDFGNISTCPGTFFSNPIVP